MDYQAHFTQRLEDIQRKLRECNYECNRMKEQVDNFVSQTREEALESAKKELEAWKTTFRKPTTEESPAVDLPKAEQPAVSEPEEKKPPVVQNEPVSRPEAVEIDLSDVVTPPPAEKNVPPATQKPAARQPVKDRPAERAQPKQRKATSQSEIERFVGENLLNKIGIAILVIGIGIFVKYAIDRDWIGEIGRVLIGILSGGILLTFAHLLRKKYKAFSSVLVGGGMATLYFTIYIGFHTYGLFSQAGAFALMAGLTAFTVVFSIAYDRQEIAVLGLIGGFAAPFLVATGAGNYKVLFSYLLILNTGMMILAAFRQWKLVNILTFFFTILVFGGWFTVEYLTASEPPLVGAIGFATAFFLVFFAMNVVFKARKKEKFGFFEYAILLANSTLYYTVGMLALWEIQGGIYQGLFTALMAVFHFAFIFPMKNLFEADRNIILMLVAMVITFITLAIPVQLEGNFITMFWAAEAVAILWLARRTRLELMHIASMVIAGLAMFGLLMDWEHYYFSGFGMERTPFVNKVFLTSLFVTGALVVIHFLEKKHEESGQTARTLGTIFFYLSIPVIYLGVLLEVLYLGSHTLADDAMATLLGGTYSALFIAGMILYGRSTGRKVFADIMMIAAAGLVLFSAVVQTELHPFNLFGEQSRSPYYHFHIVYYLSVFVMMGVLVYRVHKDFGFTSGFGQLFSWLFTATGTGVASAMLYNILVGAGFEGAVAVRVGFPILWGAIGFLLIQQGLRHKLVQLRIASLVLFLVTLVKLFAWDIQTVSTGGKIAAFISLGVLLLVVSFMYNRIKQLLIEGETQEDLAENDQAE